MFIGMGMPIPDLANLPGVSRPGRPGGVSVKGIVNNYSFEFDRASVSHFKINPSALMVGATSFSISVWVKLDATNVDGPIVARWGSQVPRFLLYYQANNSWRILFQGTDGLGTRSLTSSITATAGTWQFIVFTWDGSVIKSYQNNAVTGNVSNNFPAFTWEDFGYLLVGQDDSSASRQLGGFVDELAFYNYELTEDAIKAIYAATANGETADLSTLSTGAPVAWYRMGD